MEMEMKGIALSAFLVGITPVFAAAHVMSEILQHPRAFDQQKVTLTGEAARMVTRYGEATYTTFDLLDAKGSTVSVLVSEMPTCKQGEICRVSGVFVAEKRMILPEKVEKVSEAEPKEAGILFRQKKGGKKGTGGRSFRGVYIPE
jgi:hypothetical protein